MSHYILAAVAPDQLSVGRLGSATVQAEYLAPGDFSVLDAQFGQGGTAGNRTIAIHGVNFDRSLTVDLTINGAVVAPAIDYYRAGPDLLYATFDLTTVAPGMYDVTLRGMAGRTKNVGQSFEVVRTTVAPKLDINITAPPAFRRVFHAPWIHFPVTVSWRNDGLNDLLPPILQFTSTEPFGPTAESVLAGGGTYAEIFLAFGDVGRFAGILMPGARGSTTFQVVPRAAQEVNGRENVHYSVTPLIGV